MKKKDETTVEGEKKTPVITFELVMRWIVDNSQDAQAMDSINRLTYSFTPKYKNKGFDNHNRID